MKFKKQLVFTLLLIIIFGINVDIINATVKNQENASVVITTDIKKTQSQKQFEGNVVIHFYDNSLYNENVKLSYHIYDKNNNIIVFENERIPFVLENGKANVNISINLDEIKAIEGLKYCTVRFDLVDEKNVYWFNDNKNISFQTVDIQYANVFLNRAYDKYSYVFEKQQIQLVINVVFILIIALFVKKYKKANN